MLFSYFECLNTLAISELRNWKSQRKVPSLGYCVTDLNEQTKADNVGVNPCSLRKRIKLVWEVGVSRPGESSQRWAWPGQPTISFTGSLSHILEGLRKIISLEEPPKKNGEAFVVLLVWKRLLQNLVALNSKFFSSHIVAVGHEFGST